MARSLQRMVGPERAVFGRLRFVRGAAASSGGFEEEGAAKARARKFVPRVRREEGGGDEGGGEAGGGKGGGAGTQGDTGGYPRDRYARAG